MAMFYSRSNRLFQEYSLDDYLRQIGNSLNEALRNIPLSRIEESGEEALTKELFGQFKISAPVIDEEKIDIDAKEADIEVVPELGFHDEPITVRGFVIIVKIPFNGNGEMFNFSASTYSPSGTHEGEVEAGNLVLNYETREKDPEKIKNLWKDDISSIKQNLSWIERDIEAFNATLEGNIKAGVLKRKKDAENNKSIIDKLKD